MNFVDAALELLREAGEPVHVTELCRLAVERELLSRPGKNPLRSMKGRLTLEFKKGNESRVSKLEDDLWTLSGGQSDVSVPVKNAPPKKATAKSKTKKSDEPAEAIIDEPAADSPVEVTEFVSDDPAIVALNELYKDETKETSSVADLAEYKDAQTADEDRPMLPEIKAERHRGPRHKRKRREREPRNKESAPRSAADRPRSKPVLPARPKPTLDDLDIDIDGAPHLVVCAANILAKAEKGQSLPVRQIVQTMIREGNLDAKPDEAWRMVKGVLLLDQLQREAAGIRPRVIHHGRGLFALPGNASADHLADAERLFNAAHKALELAHRKRLVDRVSTLSPKLLERVAQTYLSAAGYCDIQWVKHLEQGCYGTAIDPMTNEPVLIGLRQGHEDVDRRGVGELRAGLEAKGMPAGLLLSPAKLSDEAKDEYAKGGLPLRILCGEAFYDALIRLGIGTSRRVVTVSTISDEFLDALLG